MNKKKLIPILILGFLSIAAVQVPDLTNLATVASDDKFYIIDKSDLTDGANGTGKRIDWSVLKADAQSGMQAADADLTTYAGITPSANVQSLLGAADYSAIRTLLATQMSITHDASGYRLSGDAGSPGNSKYYGTDGSGTKGFYAVPSGTISGLTTNTIPKATSASTIGDSSIVDNGTTITIGAGTDAQMSGSASASLSADSGVTNHVNVVAATTTINNTLDVDQGKITSEIKEFCKTLETPTDADDNIPFFLPKNNITVTGVYGMTQGGTSIAGTISDGTNAFEAV